MREVFFLGPPGGARRGCEGAWLLLTLVRLRTPRSTGSLVDDGVFIHDANMSPHCIFLQEKGQISGRQRIEALRRCRETP